jgi:tetrahydromethanopterin S-methyltransferase subunit G
MSEEVDNIIIEHLKALRNELRAFREEAHQEFADIKHRLHTVERGIASVRHENSDSFESYVRQQLSIDKINERIERIERRLELA